MLKIFARDMDMYSKIYKKNVEKQNPTYASKRHSKLAINRVNYFAFVVVKLQHVKQKFTFNKNDHLFRFQF